MMSNGGGGGGGGGAEFAFGMFPSNGHNHANSGDRYELDSAARAGSAGAGGSGSRSRGSSRGGGGGGGDMGHGQARREGWGPASSPSVAWRGVEREAAGERENEAGAAGEWGATTAAAFEEELEVFSSSLRKDFELKVRSRGWGFG